jgi:hypothetical protein
MIADADDPFPAARASSSLRLDSSSPDADEMAWMPSPLGN